jgi:uncharacterized protein YgfB (UPF0149 family)
VVDDVEGKQPAQDGADDDRQHQQPEKSVDDEEDEPSAEADYMEVTEYVRVVVNSLYFEFSADHAEGVSPASMAPASNQLH